MLKHCFTFLLILLPLGLLAQGQNSFNQHKDSNHFDSLYNKARNNYHMPQTAVAYGKTALEEAITHGQPKQIAMAHHLLGGAYNNLEKFKEAYLNLHQASHYYKLAGHDSLHLAALFFVGTLRIKGGLYQQALDIYEPGMQQALEAGYGQLYAHACQNAVIANNQLGNFEASLQLYRSLETINYKVSDSFRARILLDYGKAMRNTGRNAEAASIYHQGLALARDSSAAQANLFHNLGVLHWKEQRLDSAQYYLTRAVKLEKGTNELRIRYATNLVNFLHQDRQQPLQARAQALKAFSLLERPALVKYKHRLLQAAMGLALELQDGTLKDRVILMQMRYTNIEQAQAEIMVEQQVLADIAQAHEKIAAENRKQQQGAANSSLWLVWALLTLAALGIALYFYFRYSQYRNRLTRLIKQIASGNWQPEDIEEMKPPESKKKK